MIVNPFLQQIGPQGFNQGPPVAQEVDPDAMQANAALRARELQTRMGIRNMIQGQQQSNLAGGLRLGATQLGKALGTTISGATASTLGASSLPAEAAGSASASAAPAASALGSLASGAGQVAGVAAAGYGTYQANVSAGKNLEDLHNAIEGGNLSPEQEKQARQKLFNAGVVSTGVGGVGGGLAGWGVGGPVGAVVGAVAGASGGAREAFGAYDHPSEAFHAFADFQRNPFKR